MTFDLGFDHRDHGEMREVPALKCPLLAGAP